MCMALAITSALAAPTTNTAQSKANSSSATKTTTTSSSISTTEAPPSAMVAGGSVANLSEEPSLLYSPAPSSRLRKRHSKRHSKESSGPHSDLNELEWVNPCRGCYVPDAIVNRRQRKKKPTKIYNELKWATNSELKNLTEGKQFIDIRKFEIWKVHEGRYKFLPKLKPNGTRIPLRRWYTNMQIYVASFAYLRRVQLDWNKSKQSRDEIEVELEKLFNNSRSMLCELETALNATHPFRKNPLPQKTREEMNNILKFRTRMFALQNPYDQREADPIDLKFVKNYYYEFLKNMRTVLRNFTRRLGQKKLKQNPKEYNEIEKQQNGVSNSNSHSYTNNNSNLPPAAASAVAATTTTMTTNGGGAVGGSKKRRKQMKNREHKNQRRTSN